jgi:hypothetical protein
MMELGGAAVRGREGARRREVSARQCFECAPVEERKRRGRGNGRGRPRRWDGGGAVEELEQQEVGDDSDSGPHLSARGDGERCSWVAGLFGTEAEDLGRAACCGCGL